MSHWANKVGVAFLALLVIVAWLLARRERRPVNAVAGVIWVFFATLIAFAIAQPISHAVAEVRPFYTHPGAEVLVPKATDFSFPSDHATIAGAVLTGLWLNNRDRWLAALATLAGFLLAFSRIYVGSHYPLDVVGGLILGALVALVLRPLAMIILRWFVGLCDRSFLHPLVATRTQARHLSRA
jgi:undecaprenyl-diphosphatase